MNIEIPATGLDLTPETTSSNSKASPTRKRQFDERLDNNKLSVEEVILVISLLNSPKESTPEPSKTPLESTTWTPDEIQLLHYLLNSNKQKKAKSKATFELSQVTQLGFHLMQQVDDFDRVMTTLNSMHKKLFNPSQVTVASISSVGIELNKEENDPLLNQIFSNIDSSTLE